MRTPKDDPLLDSLALLAGYAWRALRRRWLLAMVTFGTTMALAIVLLLISSPVYRVETRVLVEPTEKMTQLVAPGRVTIPHGGVEKSPIAEEPEVVESPRALNWLIDELDLTSRWQATRTPFGRVVDAAMTAIFGPSSPEERREELLHHLGEKITTTVEDRVLVVTVEWHEPRTAFDIADALERHYLSLEKQSELGQIRDTVAILEREVEGAKTELNGAEARLHDAADGATALIERNFRRRNNRQMPDLEAVARLEREVAKRREALGRMEAGLDTHIGEAQEQLNALRARLGPTHPDVLAAERNLALQSQQPQALVQMRDEEQQLTAQLSELMPNITAAQLFEALMQGPGPVDPGLETALTDFRRRAENHSMLRERLGAARLELATQEAAFDYAHNITQPPVLPRRPVKPDAMATMLVGFVGALFLAFVMSVLRDVTSGRVQEAWQIERFLDVPVVAELEHR